MRRSRSAVLAAVVLAACFLASPAAAKAEPGRGKALVRVAHFSPDASYVDVYMVSLNRRQLFPNVFYKAVSSYWAVAAGPFTYEVRGAGAAPESDPVIQVKGELEAGKAYTVAALGPKEQLQGVLLRDDMGPSATGKGKVRFLNAAFGLPSVDVAVQGGRLLAAGLSFREPTGYRQLAAGSYRVEVRRAGADAALVKGTVAVKRGTVTSVALVGGAGKPRELFAFGDATGTRAAPVGGIRTGAGGTAPSSREPTAPVPLLAAGLGLATLAALGLAAGARRRALAVAALAIALGGCSGSPERPVGPGALTPAPGPAKAATQPAPRRLAERVDPSGPQPGIDLPAVPPQAPGFELAGLPGQLTVPGPLSPPVRLAIPAIGVATPLVRLGLQPDGGMQVPGDFGRAGWFAGGPPPGQMGPAVIAGHVDSRTGPAVFSRLRELRPGDTVQVERADGTRLRFAVEEARSFPKAAFPTAEVFGPAPSAALRLITCGGHFDRASGSYRDNLVVFARLAGVSR